MSMNPDFVAWREVVIALANHRGVAWALGDDPEGYLEECWDEDRAERTLSEMPAIDAARDILARE